MALQRVDKPSPNKSSGSSSRRIIVVHTTEGAQTNESLYNFISQSSAGVSYHVSVDNGAPNVCWEYVKVPYSSWSVSSYNGVSVNGAFCTPSGAASGWSRAKWMEYGNGLNSMAQWVAEEAKKHNIPLVALTPAQAQGTGKGVCQHSDLGQGGGGHHDCGPGFPMDELLRLAKGETPPPTGPNWPYRYGTLEDSLMGVVTQNPHIAPVPRDVKHIRLAADPGGQGAQSIAVRVALHTTNTPNWPVQNITLTQAAPRIDVTLGNTDIVALTVNGNYQVGYAFI